jgi:vacuolar-type H+-ATPase subunit I/STV1
VLESEKEKTDHQISILENNLEEKKKILHNLIMEKDKESDLIHKKSNEKIESLKKEKTRIESEFNVYSSDISTVVVEKMQ